MILCAAIKLRFEKEGIGDENGEVVITGHRHANCFELIRDLGFNPKDYKELAQGFIDHNGKFLTREEALFHANQCGQLSSEVRWKKGREQDNMLFSEDLY